MQFNEQTKEIITYRYDYGIPIIFEAGVKQGFSVGDRIIIKFSDDRIKDRDDISVNTENFCFDFKLTKEEAESISDPCIIRYSIKRYQNGKFLETLLNGYLKFRSTLRWQN